MKSHQSRKEASRQQSEAGHAGGGVNAAQAALDAREVEFRCLMAIENPYERFSAGLAFFADWEAELRSGGKRVVVGW